MRVGRGIKPPRSGFITIPCWMGVQSTFLEAQRGLVCQPAVFKALGGPWIWPNAVMPGCLLGLFTSLLALSRQLCSRELCQRGEWL